MDQSSKFSGCGNTVVEEVVVVVSKVVVIVEVVDINWTSLLSLK
jgi:hypothetical protein